MAPTQYTHTRTALPRYEVRGGSDGPAPCVNVPHVVATLQQKKAPAGAALSADVAEKVKKQYVMLHKEYRERKRKCMEVVDMLSENMGERPKKLCENLGFETDEDVGVDFKKFPVVRL